MTHSPSFPGLYIHLPFCVSRCRYCAFASNPYEEAIADRYLAALRKELGLHSEKLASGVSTLFIGGGTPSVLTVRQLENLLSMAPLPLEGGEATFEANPESLTEEKMRLLRDGGVNRLSLGVQTFHPAGLALLGRRHDAAAALAALDRAHSAGFASLSVDLIAAWPGQTPEMLVADIETAIGRGVSHISCYALTVEEGTPIFRDFVSGRLAEKSDAEAREFWDAGGNRLSERGFERYEISNHARPGKRCRHNVNCWKGWDYLGVGAAAHSHWRGRRFANHAGLAAYLAQIEQGASAECFSERLAPDAKAREGATLWLRMAEGIECGEFAGRFGISPFDLYRRELPPLLERGALEIVDNASGGKNLRLSAEAYPNADLVLVDLV